MRQISHRIYANGLTHYVAETCPETEAKQTVLLLHGFPDDHALWADVAPLLAAQNYRVIAPDLRGFGETEMAEKRSDYAFLTGPIPDLLSILDHFETEKVHLVGHDFGACVAWLLAGRHPFRFKTLTALSVGHQRSVMKQKRSLRQVTMSGHMIYHQFRGACEWAYRRNDWSLARRLLASHPTGDDILTKMKRPDRMTAALNWYRANIPLSLIFRDPPAGAFGNERIRIPTLGMWSSGDRFIPEAQMKGSGAFVDNWRYERLETLGHWFPAQAPELVSRRLIDFWNDSE